MMACVAGVGLLLDAPCLNSVLGEKKSERMAARVSGLSDSRHLWHMTADTAAKSMDSVSRTIGGSGVTALAKFVFEQSGLRANENERIGHFPVPAKGTPASVNIVASYASHPHLGMLALFPIKILLVATFRSPARPEIRRFVFGIEFIKVESYVGRAF